MNRPSSHWLSIFVVVICLLAEACDVKAGDSSSLFEDEIYGNCGWSVHSSFVADLPASKHLAWTSDGSPSRRDKVFLQPIRWPFKDRFDLIKQLNGQDPNKFEFRQFQVRFNEHPKYIKCRKWSFSPASAAMVGQIVESGTDADLFIAAAFPKSVQAVSLKIELDAPEWGTNMFQDFANPDAAQTSTDDCRLYEKSGKLFCDVQGTWSEGRSRLEVRDKKWTDHVMEKSKQSGKGDRAATTFEIPKLTKNDVSSLRFRVRYTFESVEKNISLHSGKLTNPEMKLTRSDEVEPK